MAYPRTTAVIFLLLLVGSLSFLSISALALINPMNSQANQFGQSARIEHIEGRIIAMEAGQSGIDFVVETAAGQKVQFQCGNVCRASVGHLQRHMLEHAITDVSYVDGPGKSLLALNVD
jgi:hypothetical protein